MLLKGNIYGLIDIVFKDINGVGYAKKSIKNDRIFS